MNDYYVIYQDKENDSIYSVSISARDLFKVVLELIARGIDDWQVNQIIVNPKQLANY